jgi:hypothetical protein
MIPGRMTVGNQAHTSRLGLLVALASAFFCSPQPATASELTGPRTCQVGAYLIALYDFDMSAGSFGADLWVWSTCPDATVKPLDVADFVNANQLQTRLAATYNRGGVQWSYVKVSGVFRHHWNVRSYPFDRHDLEIVMEHTADPSSTFSYTADREGTKTSPQIALDGWRITDFQIANRTYLYDTVFGDPAFAGKKQSDYSRLVLSISIARTKRWSFIKLVAGVYVAFALSALAFLLGPYNGRRRTNLLGGTLFAVLVNQRVAESVFGRVEQLTLLDVIHVVAMVYIFAIALVGIYSQQLNDAGQEERARRSDRWGLWITTISYVLLNAVLLVSAAIRG